MATDPLALAQQVLDETIPTAVLGLDGVPPEGALLLKPDRVVDACRHLKQDERLRFQLPLHCTAVDWLDREPRFDIVYQLRSVVLNGTIRVKVRVADRPDGRPAIPSVASVWVGMACHEREVFDLFGIEFEGHPDLRRILMPDDWEGHPLRKDYVSFGEPVKFTDRGSFQPLAAVPEGAPD